MQTKIRNLSSVKTWIHPLVDWTISIFSKHQESSSHQTHFKLFYSLYISSLCHDSLPQPQSLRGRSQEFLIIIQNRVRLKILICKKVIFWRLKQNIRLVLQRAVTKRTVDGLKFCGSDKKCISIYASANTTNYIIKSHYKVWYKQKWWNIIDPS